jgi:hypothetical protein
LHTSAKGDEEEQRKNVVAALYKILRPDILMRMNSNAEKKRKCR